MYHNFTWALDRDNIKVSLERKFIALYLIQNLPRKKIKQKSYDMYVTTSRKWYKPALS